MTAKVRQTSAYRRWQKSMSLFPSVLRSLAREPSERQGDRVVMQSGRDVTKEYRHGAEAALALCIKHGCKAAVLKEKSPSCGCGFVYDGTFSRRLIEGDGVTAELLKAHGIAVCGENGLPAMQADMAVPSNCR